jgi:hypothetical protein
MFDRSCAVTKINVYTNKMKTLHSQTADPFRALPREVFSQVILVLRAALPRPLMETPAEAAKRDRAALAAVATLLPENAVEGRLAAQFVAADAWAMDCLQLAQERQREPRIAERCRAQAMGMMREAKRALKALEKAQAARRALAKDAAAAERAAWVEHAAVTMMADALESEAAGEDAGTVGNAAPAHPTAAAGGRKFGLVPEIAESFMKTGSETESGLEPVLDFVTL